MMEQAPSVHPHATAGAALVPGTLTWSEWVKDYYHDVETYDWVDVVDNLRGPSALFHRNRAHVVRSLVARYATDGPFLDAGCGTGLNLRDLPAGSVGIDINPRNVDLVRARLREQSVVLGDIEAMPFADASFGAVLCTEVLEHVPNPETALSEIRRVLKPGGVLIGSVPAKSVTSRLRFLWSRCHTHEPFHDEYLREDVRELLKDWQLHLLRYSLLHFDLLFVAS